MDDNDKKYLALELTKIFYNSTAPTDAKDLMNTYKLYLSELTGIISDTETIENLLQDNKKLQDRIRDLETKQIQSFCDNKIEKIRRLINTGKGDMETYIYNGILNIINE